MSVRVVLFVSGGCGLCDDARALLRSEGVAFEEEEDPRYLLRVPVVEVGGEVVTEGEIDPRAVRRAVRRARRRAPGRA